MTVPKEIQLLLQAFLTGLKSIFRENLYAVYLYEAVTFPEIGPVSDIDFHVILHTRPSPTEKVKVLALHDRLAEEFPPLGAELDGYYILLTDAHQTEPPDHQVLLGIYDLSWALHCAHIRAGHCIVLYGPDPLDIYPQTVGHRLARRT